jgi:hypothetical protein
MLICQVVGQIWTNPKPAEVLGAGKFILKWSLMTLHYLPPTGHAKCDEARPIEHFIYRTAVIQGRVQCTEIT